MKRALDIPLRGFYNILPGDQTGDGFNNAWHSVKQEPVPGGYGRSMSGY